MDNLPVVDVALNCKELNYVLGVRHTLKDIITHLEQSVELSSLDYLRDQVKLIDERFYQILDNK